jgi:hypothetical protein
MPHYLIYHSCEITQAQYQALATAITKLHCELCTLNQIMLRFGAHYEAFQAMKEHSS